MEQVYGGGSAVERPPRGEVELMWRLALGGGGGGEPAYPERPGEPDCHYYMRTGSCGYGERCRYNHPRSRASPCGLEGTIHKGLANRCARYLFLGFGTLPNSECILKHPVLCISTLYFLRTGTCKFGGTCKYHHPRQGGSGRSIHLNSYGYPLRPVWILSPHMLFFLIPYFMVAFVTSNVE
ncbi:hypothetical protein Taro_025153 [Colocasia esculenta]|uniref:C3H1-type domain-containing protein n=1 Tax=Colocasia esculenta TaxID=4460 RepID=A0A843VFR5_COLES|nr:hypothetical protein [Colocasia esculenta]